MKEEFALCAEVKFYICVTLTLDSQVHTSNIKPYFYSLNHKQLHHRLKEEFTLPAIDIFKVYVTLTFHSKVMALIWNFFCNLNQSFKQAIIMSNMNIPGQKIKGFFIQAVDRF